MRHRSRLGLRASLGLPAIVACSVFVTAPASAEPLATAGIGVQSCAKLAKDMNPAEGFNNMTNALVYYWMQGYMSAANMALLEGDNEYVDLSLMDEKNLLPKIHEFCTKNPDKKPIRPHRSDDRGCGQDRNQVEERHDPLGGR